MGNCCNVDQVDLSSAEDTPRPSKKPDNPNSQSSNYKDFTVGKQVITIHNEKNSQIKRPSQTQSNGNCTSKTSDLKSNKIVPNINYTHSIPKTQTLPIIKQQTNSEVAVRKELPPKSIKNLKIAFQIPSPQVKNPEKKKNFTNQVSKRQQSKPKRPKGYEKRQQADSPLPIYISPSDFPIQAAKNKLQQPLNDKFQNTVRDSELQSSMRYSIIELSDYSHLGLPNIGNTCYLNSIFQMLYSAEYLNKEIIRASKNKKLKFHRLIANIFNDFKNKSSYESKKLNLHMVIKYIENHEPEFRLYKQNDAIQCFLCIINLLDEELQSSSKLDYFKIEYQPRCLCTKEDSFILRDYFVKSQQFCVRCNQNISFFIHSTGPYIVIFANSEPNRIHRQIKLKTKQDTLKYENKAFVTYFGNKRSGHYISHRKIDDGWIQISDQTVRYIGKSSNISNYAPMITLYALKN